MSADDKNRFREDDDVELHQKLMSLDWDIGPSKDLWAGIEAKLDALPTKRKQLWMPYAVAASFLVAIVSLTMSYMNLEQGKQADQFEAAYARYQQSQVDLIEQQHQMVRAQFLQLLKQRRDHLDPQLLLEVESALRTIDEAAREIKAAIAVAPYNPNYSVMLVNAYQREIKLLNKIQFKEDLSI